MGNSLTITPVFSKIQHGGSWSALKKKKKKWSDCIAQNKGIVLYQKFFNSAIYICVLGCSENIFLIIGLDLKFLTKGEV